MRPVAGRPLLLTVYALSCFCITVYRAPANMGWGRYMLIAFPCFWVVATWSSKSHSPRLSATLGVMLQVLLLSTAVIAQVTP